MAAGCPKPDVSDEAIRNLFLSHEAAEDQRTFGGPQSDLHELLDIRPPEDEPPPGDYYLDYANFVISGPPMEALDVVLRICDRAPDNQTTQAHCHTLVVNACVLSTTGYLEDAVDAEEADGHAVSDSAKAHLSFVHFEPINPYGTMVFEIAGVLKRSRRPLCRP